MIGQRVVPYQNISSLSGMVREKIRSLGMQLFPFTPYNFQLALCIYDWTTASFARLVFLKAFEYTGFSAAPFFLLDKESVAQMIWASDWGSYTPWDVDFMRSFLMEPATSLDDVRSQLDWVEEDLHKLSEVQNRLIAAAALSLPRTSVLSAPMLFSGQMDIMQLGLDHLGIEFLECPLNNGPAGQTLVFPFADALSNYISPGKPVTTKMAWSVTDKLEDAIYYANGILLVLESVGSSLVWDEPAFITILSENPMKNEYLAAPGTKFKILAADRANLLGKEVLVITLQPVTVSEFPSGLPWPTKSMLRELDILGQIERYNLPDNTSHKGSRLSGRRCICDRD